MYKPKKAAKSSLKINTSYKGERIEEKINRILNNKEPIKDGAPLLYTERSKGVLPETDIRTDRFDVALDAMDKVSKTHIAKREERIKTKDGDKGDKPPGGDGGGASPIQGT